MSPSQFLLDPASTALDADAFQNLQYSDRFKLCKTWVVRCPPVPATYNGTNGITGGAEVPFTCYFKTNTKVEYNNTTDVVASITTNSYHLLAICSDLVAAPTLTYRARTRFVG